MTRTKMVFAALCLLFSASAACAQPAVPSQPDLATAMQVLEATNAKANMLRIVDLIMPQMLTIVRQQNPALDDATLKSFQVVFHEELQASLADYMKGMAGIYARHFSEKELEGLLAFYRTDIGKKLISETPEVMKEGAALGESWGRSIGITAAQRAIARLKGKDIKI